jgi:hypothetical protein
LAKVTNYRRFFDKNLSKEKDKPLKQDCGSHLKSETINMQVKKSAGNVAEIWTHFLTFAQ